MTTLDDACKMTAPFGVMLLRHLLGDDVSRSIARYRERGYEITTGVLPAVGNKPEIQFIEVRKNGWLIKVLEQNRNKASKYAQMARDGHVLCWAILSHPQKCPGAYWICYHVDPNDPARTVNRLKPNPGVVCNLR